jgi:hypothetical protein
MLKPFLVFAALACSAPLLAQKPAPPPAAAGPRSACRMTAPGGELICIAGRTEGYEFSFGYPRAAADYPALDALLREEAVREEAELNERLGAAPGPDHPTRHVAFWRIDASLPELIALSGDIVTSRGGAQIARERRTILFDLLRNRVLRLDDLFDPAFLDNSLFGHRIRGMQAAQAGLCHQLIGLGRARPGTECTPVEDLPVTMMCGPRGRIESIQAFISPDQSVLVPVDAAMIGAMKRRYRVAFGLPGETRGRRRTCGRTP